MGNQDGQAGKSTRDRAKRIRQYAWLVTIWIILLIAIVGVLFIKNQFAFGFIGGGVFTLLFYLAARILMKKFDVFLDESKKKERKFNQGAAGEEQVGEILEQLGSDYLVMHDFAIHFGTSPYGNIDHIVYDKKGNIFILETKSHFGKVTANGDHLLRDGRPFEKDIIHQALSNSYWVKEKVEAKLGLKAWVTPVLVFTNAFVQFGKPIKGVYYTNKKYLLQFLQTHKANSPAGLKLWEMKNYKSKEGVSTNNSK